MDNNFYIAQTDDAKDLPLPRYMTPYAAGMDLYANVTEDVTIGPMEIKLVGTGIRLAMPENREAQIRPRSGLALKNGISMVNAPGTIDADYRGEVKVILINLSKEDFVIKRGDRIAQMVFSTIERVNFTVLDALSQTERGEGGFGHTLE